MELRRKLLDKRQSPCATCDSFPCIDSKNCEARYLYAESYCGEDVIQAVNQDILYAVRIGKQMSQATITITVEEETGLVVLSVEGTGAAVEVALLLVDTDDSVRFTASQKLTITFISNI